MMMGKTAFVCLAAIALVLPGVAAMDKACKLDFTNTKTCAETLAKGEKFTLDCTGLTTRTIPSTLLDQTTSAAKVCSETTARTTHTAACGTEVTLDSLKSKNITVTPSTSGGTGFSLTNTDYNDATTMILTGACSTTDGSKYGYFNVTFMKAGATGSNSASGLGVSVAALAAAFIGVAA